ncbi:MAG: solute-binding protein [Anaerolineae bacterium]|nr:solute-binding protein [Anaerolineae bacterium]
MPQHAWRLSILLFVLGLFIITACEDTTTDTPAEVAQPRNPCPAPIDVPENGVLVLVDSSNTKELWFTQMQEQFNAANIATTAGNPVRVQVWHKGSTLDTRCEPAAWSPSDQIRVEGTNQEWRDTNNNQSLISATCPSTLSIPIGIAMWEPMARALGWPTASIGWDDIIALATAPDGWGSVGHPEWGRFRYGHGHPAHSTSGRLSVVAQIFAAKGSTEPLVFDDVWAEATQEQVGAVQTAIAHYGRIDTALLDRMVERGPQYLHAITNYEGNVIRWNAEHFGQREAPWNKIVLIYPEEGTFWVDHPFCVLDGAPWVTPEEAEGARLFRDFITAPEQQAQLPATGIRAVDPAVPLDVPGSPLTLENGVIPTLSQAEIPALPIPEADVMQNVIEMWEQVKKPSTVVLVIDTSGSMDGEPMQAAIAGAQNFLNQMHPNDRVVVLEFNDRVLPVQPSGLVGEVGETLRQAIGGLSAGGGTALHAATIEGVRVANELRAADMANGESRIYGVVLMTDGENTAEDGVTQEMMLNVLPDGLESDQVRLHTIGYGAGADSNLLENLANRTNGSFSEGTIDNIDQVYFLISSEF